MWGKLQDFSLPKAGEATFINMPLSQMDVKGTMRLVKSDKKSTYGKPMYQLDILALV